MAACRPHANHDKGDHRSHGLLCGSDRALRVHEAMFADGVAQKTKDAQLQLIEEIEEPQAERNFQAEKIRQANDDEPKREKQTGQPGQRWHGDAERDGGNELKIAMQRSCRHQDHRQGEAQPHRLTAQERIDA